MHTSIIYCITEHSASWFARNWVSRTHSTAYVTKTTSTAGQLRRNSRGIIFSMLKSSFRSKFRFILLQFIYYAGLICTVGSTISSTRQYWRSFSSVFFSSPPHTRSYHTYLVSITQTCFFLLSAILLIALLCTTSSMMFFFSSTFSFCRTYLFILCLAFFFYFGAMPSSFTFSFIAHSYFCTWAKVLSIYFFFVFRENMGKSMGCGSGDVEVKRKRDREHGL